MKTTPTDWYMFRRHSKADYDYYNPFHSYKRPTRGWAVKFLYTAGVVVIFALVYALSNGKG